MYKTVDAVFRRLKQDISVYEYELYELDNAIYPWYTFFYRRRKRQELLIVLNVLRDLMAELEND